MERLKRFAGLLGVLATWAAAESPWHLRPEDPYIGTFAYAESIRGGSFHSLAVTLERRGDQVQATGFYSLRGNIYSDIKGTFYPTSKTFKGTLRERSGQRIEVPIDGSFDPVNRELELTNPFMANSQNRFYCRPIADSDLRKEFVTGSSRVRIRSSGRGYEVSGTYDGKPIKGSYSLRTNSLRARVEGNPGGATFIIDGHFNPSDKSLLLIVQKPDRPVGGETFLTLGSELASSSDNGRTATRDPAGIPGAIWRQRETYQAEIAGEWILQSDGKTFKAKWANKAEATLTQSLLTSTEVKVTRHDQTGVSKGLKAEYSGKRTGSRVEGDVHWTWADGKKGTGKWSADLPSGNAFVAMENHFLNLAPTLKTR